MTKQQQYGCAAMFVVMVTLFAVWAWYGLTGID